MPPLLPRHYGVSFFFFSFSNLSHNININISVPALDDLLLRATMCTSPVSETFLECRLLPFHGEEKKQQTSPGEKMVVQREHALSDMAYYLKSISNEN